MRTAVFLQTYAASLVVFLMLDFAWLGLIARGFYRQQLGHLLGPGMRWIPAIIFYLLFVAADLVFAVAPAVERGSLGRALLLGGFFGDRGVRDLRSHQLGDDEGLPDAGRGRRHRLGVPVDRSRGCGRVPGGEPSGQA